MSTLGSDDDQLAAQPVMPDTTGAPHASRATSERRSARARVHARLLGMAYIGALVVGSAQPEQVVEFYRRLGLPLIEENHGDGVVHWACELDGVHFAVFRGEGDGTAPGYHQAGSTCVGFAVDSVADAIATSRSTGATIVQAATEMPWGLRAIICDPDGRPVEVFEPRHAT